VKIGSVTTGTTYLDKKGLVTGTKYSYYVVAYDLAGNLSRPSATVSGVPK
jgi:chitodextrinase